MFIEHRDNAEYENYTFDDELFSEELEFQTDIIALLEKHNIIDEVFISTQKIQKSKLGGLLVDMSVDFIGSIELDDEIQEWIKEENINIKELIPDLVRNFYQSIKKLRSKAAI